MARTTKKTVRKKSSNKKLSGKKNSAKSKSKKPTSKKITRKKSAKLSAKKINKRKATSKKKKNSSWIPGHPHPEPKVKRIRTAKGRRPYFFDDPNIDKLLAMIMALAGEVSVMRERLDTHERLATKKKFASHQAIEDYDPDNIAEAFRSQWRSEFIARVLRIVQVELDQISREDGDKEYEKIIDEVSKE
tara:strand:+ start:47 stop:613 length:567 start_codon:yes stop_codon:yes gene_type:complete